MKKNNIKCRLLDIADYLEQAGFIDAADIISTSVDCMEQNNIDFSLIGQDVPRLDGMSSLSMPFVVAKTANELDDNGMYEEADFLDDLLEDFLLDEKFFEKMKSSPMPKENSQPKPKDMLARSNGLVELSLTDSNGSMYSGFNDWVYYVDRN